MCSKFFAFIVRQLPGFFAPSSFCSASRPTSSIKSLWFFLVQLVA